MVRLILGFLASLTVMVFIDVALGVAWQRTINDLRELKIQAVQHGYAEWDVDVDGSVEWKWIDQEFEKMPGPAAGDSGVTLKMDTLGSAGITE